MFALVMIIFSNMSKSSKSAADQLMQIHSSSTHSINVREMFAQECVIVDLSLLFISCAAAARWSTRKLFQNLRLLVHCNQY